MPQLKLDVDPETYARLVAEADAERRPVNWHAEVTLRRAMGLPFPPTDSSAGAGCPAERKSAR